MGIRSDDDLLTILRSASSANPATGLEAALAGFRRQWMALAERRYASLREDHEDAVQLSLLKLVDPDRLAGLHDAARLAGWGRSLFVNTLLDLARDRKRHERRRVYVAADTGDAEHTLLEAVADERPTPEEALAQRERLDIVRRAIDGLEIARLKFVEELSDKEIADRVGSTRDGVAGQLKRLRKQLRASVGDVQE